MPPTLDISDETSGKSASTQHQSRTAPRACARSVASRQPAGAEMRRRHAWSQQRTIFLEVFEPKTCRCTVRDAPDLQKVGGEPSSRSLKCCEL